MFRMPLGLLCFLALALSVACTDQPSVADQQQPEIQISEEILAAARAHMEAADAATYEYESSEDDIGENDEELFKNYVHEAENEEDVFGNINLAAFRRRTVQQD